MSHEILVLVGLLICVFVVLAGIEKIKAKRRFRAKEREFEGFQKLVSDRIERSMRRDDLDMWGRH